MAAILDERKLRHVLAKMLDENEEPDCPVHAEVRGRWSRRGIRNHLRRHAGPARHAQAAVEGRHEPEDGGIMCVFKIAWVYYGLLIASRPVILWNLIAIVINALSVGAYMFSERGRVPERSDPSRRLGERSPLQERADDRPS
jgi:hypothetical protein